jgi:type II secretory pathway pseudopilin PulG
MCSPTIALSVASIASAGLQYKMGKAQQQAQYAAQKRQNELAKKNAIQRYASAQLKIRQELTKSAQADLRGTLKARKARATYIAGVGDAGGLAISGSTNALLANYYRTEGNFRNAIRNNMAINISQYERNLEAIQFGQESQSTYVTPPNSSLLFATQALNVANTYYSLQFQKQNAGLMSGSEKKGQTDSVEDVWV